MTRTDLQAALLLDNVHGFLHAIRLGEGTSDDAGYNRIVGGQTFTDMSTHPNVRVFIPKYNVWSTAAGAYQITHPTWLGLVAQYEFTDFSPEQQDEMAVALIAGRKALDFVKSGDLQAAVTACNPEWASLPGSTAGQRTEAYANVQQAYLDNGGTLQEAA